MVAVTGGYSVTLAVDEIKKKRKSDSCDDASDGNMGEITSSTTIPESAAKSAASPSSATSVTSSDKKRKGLKDMFSRMRRKSVSPTTSGERRQASPHAYSGSPFKSWGEADSSGDKSPMFP